MKLSKNNLRKALFALADVLFVGSSEFAEKAINALKDGDLEIEGYERVQWVKFNPKDPKTFPPKNEHLEIFECSKKHRWREVNMLTEFWWQRVIESWSINVNSRGYTIYWRPLPPPPIETEEKND